jgi:CubicO group peptidase (beta-lactamase class C family)
MRWWLVVLFACGGGGSTPVTPTEPAPKPNDAAIDVANLKSQLPPYVASVGAGEAARAFSGYVLVAQRDEVLYSQAFGFADRAKQRVATADTSFRIGSVTKQFTAAAILRLEQDGKLSVDDKVSKHLPEFPGPGKDVTIHQLLTHTSGVMNFTQDPNILARKHEKRTVAELLALFWDKPLDFPPGTRFSYSNGGYATLGAIIERASGMPYGNYLETALFAPAKLTRTVVGDALGDPDRAEGYQIADNAVVPADKIDMSMPFAAGAIRSTANDLVRWHRALSGDAILGAAARAKLYRVERDGYAYAWMVQEIKGRRTVWHNGGIDGFSTMYWRIPDADVVVIVLGNILDVPADPIGKAAIDAALGDRVEPIAKLERGKLDPARIALLVGTYEMAEASKATLVAMKAPQALIDSILSVEVAASPRGVTVKPNGQSGVELEPLADGTFYDAAHRIRVRYELPASGPATSVTLEQGQLVVTYRRAK